MVQAVNGNGAGRPDAVRAVARSFASVQRSFNDCWNGIVGCQPVSETIRSIRRSESSGSFGLDSRGSTQIRTDRPLN